MIDGDMPEPIDTQITDCPGAAGFRRDEARVDSLDTVEIDHLNRHKLKVAG